MRAQIDQVRIKPYRLVAAAHDPRLLAEHLHQYELSIDHVAQARIRYEPLISSADEKVAYDEFLGSWSRYEAASDAIKSLVASDKTGEALDALIGKDNLALYDAMSAGLDRDVKLNDSGAQRDANGSVVAARDATIAAWIAIILSLAVGLGATLYGMRRISVPLGRITRMMGSLATGDTTVDVPFKTRRDEIGAMAAAVQVFKDNRSARDSSRRRPRSPAPRPRRSGRPACARWRMPSRRRSAASSAWSPPRRRSCRRPPGP